MNMNIVIGAAALAALASGCEPSGDRRVAALDAAAWRESVWISVPEAKQGFSVFSVVALTLFNPKSIA